MTTRHLWDGQFDLISIHISYVMPSPTDVPPGYLLPDDDGQLDTASECGECTDGKFFDSISEAIEDFRVDIITHCAVKVPGIHTL